MIDHVELMRILGEELPTQRWFGASAVTGIDRVREIGDVLQVIVRGDDGHRYQALVDRAGHDATMDPTLALEILHEVMPDEDVSKVRPLGAEQSNTSLVYDERLVLKVFRRLPEGLNPDVEVTRELARVGFEQVLAPVAEWRDGDDDYGVVNELLASAIDGWQLALTSLHDLYDRRVAPDESPGDFGFEAERLGATVAQLHTALIDAFGEVEPDVEQWIADMHEQLDRVELDETLKVRARAVYDALRDTDARPSFRVHGDLHLGQTMLHDRGWFILDFEGEPFRPIEERRRPSSPMRDVAGMVRSFHYAAEVALRDMGSTDDEERAALGRAWEQHNAARFLEGYRGYAPVNDIVRRAFELDKAVYEVGYERAHRPDWVAIPLSAVKRLLEVS